MKSLVKALARPVNLIVHAIHGQRRKHRHITAVLIGGSIGLLGVAIATCEQHFVPHIIQDFAGYTIHGIGIAPIIERVLNCLSVTD